MSLKPPLVLCLLLSVFSNARAEFKGEFDLEGSYAGNSKDSLDAALGERDRWDGKGWLRLMWSGESASGWAVDLAYLARLNYGDSVSLSRTQQESYPELLADPDRSELLRLRHTLADHDKIFASQRMDRFSVSYTTSQLVLRIGRQALTWGSGLVFHPMDLFNPFPPNATYTNYKPGADMLYGQWLFDSGADLQAVITPRRELADGSITADAASGGVKWHSFLGDEQQFGVDVLVAKDYRSQVLGLGASGALGGAAWNAETIMTRLSNGDWRSSWLVNIQNAWQWDGKNINGYIEFFHNDFGVAGSDHSLTELPAVLTERLANGTLFTVAKEYLATGAEIQWTPLLTLKPLLVNNLDDASALIFIQGTYSLSQNTTLTGGLQWTLGGHGTEYGGMEVNKNSGVYSVPADRLYLRFTWYF